LRCQARSAARTEGTSGWRSTLRVDGGADLRMRLPHPVDEDAAVPREYHELVRGQRCNIRRRAGPGVGDQAGCNDASGAQLSRLRGDKRECLARVGYVIDHCDRLPRHKCRHRDAPRRRRVCDFAVDAARYAYRIQLATERCGHRGRWEEPCTRNAHDRIHLARGQALGQLSREFREVVPGELADALSLRVLVTARRVVGHERTVTECDRRAPLDW